MKQETDTLISCRVLEAYLINLDYGGYKEWAKHKLHPRWVSVGCQRK